MSLPSGAYAGISAISRRDSHGTPVGISFGMPMRRFVPGSQREFGRDSRADKNGQTKLNEIRFRRQSHQSNISLPLNFPLPLIFFRERSEVFTMLEFANCHDMNIFARVKEIGLRQNTRVVNAHSCLSTTYSFLPLVLCSSVPNPHLPSQVFPLITDLIESKHYLVSCANCYFSYFHNS